MLKKVIFVIGLCCAGSTLAQTVDFTGEDQWKVYDDFHKAFWCTTKSNYKSDTKQPSADHRGNGDRDKDYSGCSAAIWCQAIYYDMAINAYRRAVAEGNTTRISKYKNQANTVYNGLKAHYVNFDFDNNNTNNGWFVYDDIMWWTAALARASQLYTELGNNTMAKNCLTYSERSFMRVWYGSKKVGDDGSYADPARGLPGGMFWEWQPISSPKPHTATDFRSACINFPTVISACLLHQLVPEGRTPPTSQYPTQQTKEWYLEKAKEIYDCAQKTFVVNGRVADGIHSTDITKREYSDHLYNQATFIGASCLLYKLTGETKYLTLATQGVNYSFMTMGTGTQKYLP
ncbi:MAG: alpha-1,6-mannanase, partial [Bacteroidaceae bacterium]|nr:alpha-1,6-mannanase [Bacteroidaceae bacterium]